MTFPPGSAASIRAAVIDGAVPRRCDVLVIGAGVSGLVTAREIRRQRPGWDVQIIDVAAYAGGKLRSADLAGAPIDVGAESIVVRRPEGLRLIDDLGLRSSLVHPGSASARVWGVDGPAPLPPDTVMGVPSSAESVAVAGILSPSGLDRLRAAPAAAALAEDASVAEVVGAQLGPEVVDRMVEPLLAGVYAGRADRLSLKATVPGLWRALQDSPLVLDAARQARQQTPQQSGPVFGTLNAGGLARLPAEIIADGDLAITLSTPARSIERAADGFTVAIGAAPRRQSIAARRIVVATPPQKAAKLLASIAPTAASELAAVQTSTMAVVALAFRRASTTPQFPGSGLLLPVSLGSVVKAFTFVTTKWPHLSSEHTIVRASIGRIGEDHVLQRDDAELVHAALKDLRALCGVEAVPVDALVQRWAGSLPQYDVGHLSRVHRIRAAVAEVPGLAVAGATYDGVGITGCITSATAAAQQIIEDHRLTEEYV